MPDRFTVLHVDNDPDDRLFLARAFTRIAPEFALTCVQDGEEAKNYLVGNQPFADRDLHPFPSLIVLDRQMPHCSGLEFLSWLRTHPDLDEVNVVMLSSSDSEDDVLTAFASGANAYHVKPIDWSQWLALAEKLRAKWGPQTALS